MRDFFPIFAAEGNGSLIYLDSAATSQKPREVIEVLTDFYQNRNGTVHRSVYRLAAEATQQYDAVRRAVQAFIGAEFPEEIIFTKGTTDAINLVASSFGKAFIREGDEILVVETEHHSNLIPWQLLCEEKKGVLKKIPVNDRGEIDLDVLEKMLSPRVRLVATAHVANATGAVHPVSRIIAMARGVGAKVLVDAAQSIAHLRIDVRDMQPDFLVFSGHKMYGPTGVGILYGKKDLLDVMPPYQGGGDMVQTVSFERAVYQSTPLKFEAGTPSVAQVVALGAAIAFLQKTGFDYIEQTERVLTRYAVERLSRIEGLRFLCQPTHRSSIVTFFFEECHPLDIGTFLDLRNIAVRTGHLCAQPTLQRFGVSSVIRVSFALYNTLEEIDLFAEALEEIVETLKGKTRSYDRV